MALHFTYLYDDKYVREGIVDLSFRALCPFFRSHVEVFTMQSTSRRKRKHVTTTTTTTTTWMFTLNASVVSYPRCTTSVFGRVNSL